MKELLGFFINHVFVGVFQYESGTPKHALELKKKSIFFFILPKRVGSLWSGTEGPRSKIQGSVVFLSLFLFVSSVKSVLGHMASTATLKYGPKI